MLLLIEVRTRRMAVTWLHKLRSNAHNRKGARPSPCADCKVRFRVEIRFFQRLVLANPIASRNRAGNLGGKGTLCVHVLERHLTGLKRCV